MKEDKVYIQIQCPTSVREMAYKVVAYRGVTIAHAIREYFKKAYNSLPEDAK